MKNWSKRHHWLTVLILTLVSFGAVPTGFTESDSSKAKLEEKARSLFARDDRIGLAVVLHFGGRTRFFLEGWADYDRKIPVTLDSLFNLASVSKVFDAALLSLAAHEGELTLDEPISKYVPEVEGKHAGGITLRQLASHTSGFTLPQDHPPWPQG